jgi:hypothetical protein
MKPVFTAFLLSILFVNIASAQASDDIPAFGKIDSSELQMKECSFEHDAPAMTLLSYKYTDLVVGSNGNSKITTTTKYRIKIFNKNGFKYANVVIPNSGGSKITNVQGVIYNLDETKQVQSYVLSDDDIFKTKSKKDNSTRIAFAFPNVKQGSVIEYQFTSVERNSYFLPSWYFQDDIPTLLSLCKISKPVLSQIQKRVVSDLPVEEGSDIDDSKGFDERKVVLSYTMRNIPAFKPEPFMSSYNDYEDRIDFLLDPKESYYSAVVRQSDDQWSLVNSWLLNSPAFGWQFNTQIKGTESFIDSVNQLQETAQKIDAVYKYVKRNLKWTKEHDILSYDLNDVWKSKEGGSAEINLTILNILRKCNVQCYPVLFSTRLHGKVDYNFTSLGQFNTIDIAAVDGNKFCLLDGTNPYLSYQTPPYNVVNTTGMIIDPVNNFRINVDFGRALIRNSTSITATVDSSGNLKGDGVKTLFDLAKIAELEIEKDSKQEEDKPEIASDLKIDSSYQLNKDDELLPLVQNFKFNHELPVTNDFYFLNPFLFFELDKNPFQDTARRSDIDFVAKISYIVNMKIALSKGMAAEELAKNKEIEMPDSSMSFTYSNELKNDTIFISSTLQINKPVFDKQDYKQVKKFFEDIYGLLNNQVLLRKKDD